MWWSWRTAWRRFPIRCVTTSSESLSYRTLSYSTIRCGCLYYPLLLRIVIIIGIISINIIIGSIAITVIIIIIVITVILIIIAPLQG